MINDQNRFPLGRVVAKSDLLDALSETEDVPQQVITGFVSRHVAADWGEVDAEEWQTNDRALRDGDRVLSAYTSPGGIRLWIITEADRSTTTVLLPENID